MARRTHSNVFVLVLGAAVGVALLASACGGSPANGVAHIGTTTTSTAPSTARNVLAFVRCMRRHGVNMPDDMTDSPATPWGGTDGMQHAALQACRQLMPPGHTPHRPSAQELKRFLAYAVCMRANGVQISDPDPATGDMQLPGYPRARTTDPRLQTDPVLKVAQTACKGTLPGYVQRKMSGPGGKPMPPG